MKYKKIKGTQDILPDQSRIWQHIEETIRKSMKLFNYKEIRTPVFELTEVFARGIGQLTDIVSKEMYTFQDKGKKSITLKPEMTAPVIRAYLENNLAQQAPLNKYYYITSLFRQENPQAGRLRQFNQFGAEALGAKSADLDVELIMLALFIYNQLGLSNLNIKLNSVGYPQTREKYKKELKKYFKPLLPKYCNDCKNRYEHNPLRILDCKNKSCQELNKNAPRLLDYLEPESNSYFEEVKQLLTDNAITFDIDPYLVRGLDYYTDTVFEITSENLGSQDAICGGGRYDLLAEQFDGPYTPSVGFASGIERLLMVMNAQNKSDIDVDNLDIYLCVLGKNAASKSMVWLKTLRDRGLKIDRDYLNRSVKAQMRDANKQKVKFVFLLGDNELEQKMFSVKDMKNGTQSNVKFSDIDNFLNIHFTE